MSSGIKLSVQKERAITLLLTGKTKTDVANEIGIRLETLSRWLHHDPHFVAAFNDARQDMWGSFNQRLRALAGQALDTLEELLSSSNESLRLRAVELVLKSVGAPWPGPTTPEEIEERWEWRKSLSSLF